MRKLQIYGAFLLTLAATQANAGHQNTTAKPLYRAYYRLVCHLAPFNGQNSLEVDYTVDEITKTVNSYAATITPAAIYLDHGKGHTVIDRYTGKIVITTSGEPTDFGDCGLAGPRKF